MIATDAAAALALQPHPAPGAPTTGPSAAHLRRLRARIARDVAVMLGVPAARVPVTDDPARRYGGHAWHLITLHAASASRRAARLPRRRGHQAGAAARGPGGRSRRRPQAGGLVRGRTGRSASW